jgi:antitoxin VapB
MSSQRQVRLLRNGRNQALRIPREFELNAQEAILRQEDGRLVIEPVRRAGLLATLAGLAPIEDEFPDIDRDLRPLDDIRL